MKSNEMDSFIVAADSFRDVYPIQRVCFALAALFFNQRINGIKAAVLGQEYSEFSVRFPANDFFHGKFFRRRARSQS